MFEVSTKVEPISGGELVRASSICAFTITIQQLGHRTRVKQLMYEVVVDDQSEWAVCGRQAGVVNMETARKQTVVVEIMALAGGHLFLPRVELFKYIEDPTSAVKGNPSHLELGINSNRLTFLDKSSARSESFAVGQVYQASALKKIHVLPPLPNAAAATAAVNNVSTTVFVKQMMAGSHSPATSVRSQEPSSLLLTSPGVGHNKMIDDNCDYYLDRASLP